MEEDEIIIQVNGENVPLSPFVRRIIRKTVLAMVSTLKKVEISGEEKVEIIIRK